MEIAGVGSALLNDLRTYGVLGGSAEESAPGALEEGRIFFFYEPRSDGEEGRADSEDHRRLSLVLAPKGRDLYRLAVVGNRRLTPATERGRHRAWCFVQTVSRDEHTIRTELGVPATRPAGQGVYRILAHDGHTHLAYSLDLPEANALDLEGEESFVLAIRNPDEPTPPESGLPSHRRPEYPDTLRHRFQDQRFIGAEPTDLLDYEGAELLLVSAAQEVREALGIDLDQAGESETSERIFRDLGMERSQHPAAPLFEGEGT